MSEKCKCGAPLLDDGVCAASGCKPEQCPLAEIPTDVTGEKTPTVEGVRVRFPL